MNIAAAQWIDFWLGVPLCFLLSLVDKAASPFRQRKPSTPPRKILFVKLSELGATVLAYPLLMEVKKKYPGCEIFFLTFERNRPIFKIVPGVVPDSNVFLIREDFKALPWDALRAIRKLRKLGVDTVFDLEFFSRVSAILSYLCGAARRVGFDRYHFEGLYRGGLLTHRIPYNPLVHVTKNYLALLQNLDAPENHRPQISFEIDPDTIPLPSYSPDAETRQQLLSKLQSRGIDPARHRIFLMNAGEGMLPLREWPVENFLTVANFILEDPAHWIVMVGTDGASEKSEWLKSQIKNDRFISLVNQTSLRELMELFHLSRGLIANDCGLAHLAMLTPLRKYVFFGPESPQIFGPLGKNNVVFYSHWPCSPCLSAFNHRKSDCTENVCLKVIEPQQVCSRLAQDFQEFSLK